MEARKNSNQSMDELRERYEHLKAEKIRAEANLKTSSQTLANLQKEAREKYDTDDLTLLRAKLAEMTQENERKQAEYQAHLAEIEAQLAKVEAGHAEAACKESER